MERDITKYAITAFKQYCIAAGVKKGNIVVMMKNKKMTQLILHTHDYATWFSFMITQLVFRN